LTWSNEIFDTALQLASEIEHSLTCLQILKKYGTEWIHSITDITDFVKSQKKILDREGQKELMTPRERVYQVQNYTTTSRISLDVFDVSVSI
jgi:hypothetical protein